MKEIKVLEGKVVAPEGMKVGIVASRFNEIIVNKLLGGAVDGLVRHGVEEENITAAWVPGAFEIPVAASAMAKSGKYDAIICVGAVIRGDTTHYDYVCSEVSKGIAQVGLAEKMPVLFGVLTTENIAVMELADIQPIQKRTAVYTKIYSEPTSMAFSIRKRCRQRFVTSLQNRKVSVRTNTRAE